MKDLINKSSFFAGKKTGEVICSNILDNINLSEFDFNIRFVNSIKTQNEMSKLTDLLNTDYADIINLPNCGNKSLHDARIKILEWSRKNENADILSQNDNVHKFPFLKYIKFNLSDIKEDVMNLNLNELNFEIRFLQLLEKTPELITVGNLLNQPSDSFRYKVKCSESTIKKVQKLLTNLLRGKIKIPPANIKFIFERLAKSANIEIYSNNEALLNTDLRKLDFENRFYLALPFSMNMNTLRDLLSTSPNVFLMRRNCGIESIKRAQEYIIDLFSGKQGIVFNNDKKIDENILMNLRRIIKNERDLNIFLRYYNYNNPRKINLTQIAAQYGLSRERVRQIVETYYKKISWRLQIFDYLVKELKSFGYIYTMEKFISCLIKNNLWGEKNYKFAEVLIREFINYRIDISVKGNFVLTVDIDNLLPAVNLINELISDRIRDLHNGIDTEEIIVFLKEHFESTGDYDKGKLLNTDVFTFISMETKSFHVVENKIYNEMMFQIYFGKLLKDVVYWSMKLISEPIHYSQLSEYIIKNNINFKKAKKLSVQSILINKELYILAGYGKYALKDSQVEIYRSAIDAIILLLKEKGPLPEKELLEHLIKKYSYGNLKIAIKNNINKRIIRKGKDLYDIKNKSKKSLI